MTNENSNAGPQMVRAAIRQKNGQTRPAYGFPQPDGSFVEDSGVRHPPNTWFRSRQADGEGGDDQ